jgi:predicted nuclease of restriction endonuclease-like RecB superfamily
VLTKDLLRVSRRGGSYYPEFIGHETRPLAAQLLGIYDEHLNQPRRAVDAAVEAIEREESDFKLVRGLAALLDREATFETVAPLPPERTRRRAFEAAEAVGVATTAEREQAIEQAADRLAVDTETIETSLYADRGCNQRLTEFDCRWDPETLIEQYNLSLAQTALFDATEVRITSDDPRTLISAIKRLRLMYEIERTESKGPTQRTVVVTGPDRLFRRTRRYGTAFARLLRSVAASGEWELKAIIDDRGTERELVLTESDISVPGVDPLAEPSYDSGVEADFAARFSNLDLDWELHREPDLLETGSSVMIPDFAFDYRYADFRVYFEVMGFWTPEYVDKKLSQLEAVEDVDLIVAVDDSLGVGEEITAADHRAIPYSGSVRLKDVVDVLREYEADLVEAASADLPESFHPDADVTTVETVAEEYGVSTDALDGRSFPDHERLGGLLVRPAVLADVSERLTEGMSLTEAEGVLSEYGLTDTSAVLSAVDYRVVWDGLTGGTLEKR